MAIQLTSPTEKDVYGIQEVFYQCWLDTYPNKEAGITVEDIKYKFRDAFTEKTLQQRKAYLLDLPANVRFVVAKDEERVTGICWQMKKATVNLLQAIYVLPGYQRKGIGYMLWQDALHYFGSEKDILVQVAVYNIKAIAFYERLGFIPTGNRFTDERHRMKSGTIITDMEMILSCTRPI